MLVHTPARLSKPVALSGFLLALILAGTALPQDIPTGKVIKETVHSAALERNLLGDSPERSVTIYLPPGYQTGTSHYPVVYLLHGFSQTNKSWTEDADRVNVPKIMDRLIASGKSRELIVVMPDGSNKLGGAFYTDSVTTGNWEAFVTRELVNYVDGWYRTVPSAGGRGIAGHSMGGYGAIKLAMKHPEIYGAAYALSACCLAWEDGWTAASPVWDKTLSFKSTGDLAEVQKFIESGESKDPKWIEAFRSLGLVALSAAWSPNPGHPPFFVDFPVERRNGARVTVETAQAEWSANLPLAMLGQYRSNLAELRGIAFDIGRQDWNPSLVTMAEDLDRALTRSAILHEFAEFDGNHSDKLAERIETKAMPFFSRVLE